MLQLFSAKRLPEPEPSQKMSGSLRPKSLATTELSLGAVPPNPRTKTTPPEKMLGPEGTLPAMWLPVTSTPCAPKSEMPTPEIGGRFLGRRARAIVVQHLVAPHLEVAGGTWGVREEQHAQAIVVDPVSGDGSPESIADEDAKQVAVGLVAQNLRVRVGRAAHVDSRLTSTAGYVRGYLRPGRKEGEDAVLLVIYEAVVRELSIAGAEGESPSFLKFLTVKPLMFTSLTYSLTSPLLKFTSPSTQMPDGPHGEPTFAGGAITALVPRSEIPFLRITNPHGGTGYEDGVARVRGVDGLLDRLTRSHNILRPRRTDTTD